MLPISGRPLRPILHLHSTNLAAVVLPVLLLVAGCQETANGAQSSERIGERR